jgi:hypothetical protein
MKNIEKIFIILIAALAIVFLYNTKFSLAKDTITVTRVGRVDYYKCSNGHEWHEGIDVNIEKEPKRKAGPKPTPTPTPTPAPPAAVTPKSNQQWTSVLGYTSSFNQCSNLCVQYQQSNCNSQYVMNYCNSIVSLDLNRDGKIVASETGSTPSATRNCETNVRCYDVIPNCECGNQPLNIASCINLFYQAYTKTGVPLFQALQNVAHQTTSGCNPPGT